MGLTCRAMSWLQRCVTCSFSGNASPRAGRGAERERRVCLRLHRGAPANASPDLPLRHDQIRITPPQVHTVFVCCICIPVLILTFFSIVASLSLSHILPYIISSSGQCAIWAHGKMSLPTSVIYYFSGCKSFFISQLHYKLKKSFQFT